MNQLLESIAIKSSADLCDLIREGEADILAAIHKMQTEAQANDTSPKFALTYKVAIDFDKSTFDCDLSWSLKQTLSVSHSLDDPNQGQLPIEGEATVTLSTPGVEPVVMTARQFSAASKKLSKKI